MAGIHGKEAGHLLVSGEKPEVGLRVYTNNLDLGTITEVKQVGDCGYYCSAWHTVALDDGGSVIMNCDRLTTHLNF